MTFLKYIWEHQKLPLLIFLIAIGASLHFSVQFIARTAYFNDPKHKQQPIEAWMTPRYVGMSYRLPPSEMADVLQLTPAAGPRPRMGEIAAALGLSLAEVESLVKSRAAQFHGDKK